MAKGLKAGDKVSVSKLLRFRQKSPEFKSGLKSVKPGQIGQVLEAAQGRSVIVEFEGKRALVSSQRLQKIDTGEPRPRRGRKPGVRAAEANAAPVAEVVNTSAQSGLFNYDSPKFAASIANKLLLNGGMTAETQSVVVEINLAELPSEVQARIQA